MSKGNTTEANFIAYTFNAKRLRQKVGFRSLSLYLTANNLLTFTPLIEGDPATEWRQQRAGRLRMPRENGKPRS